MIENNTIVSTLYDLLPLTYNNTGIATSTATDIDFNHVDDQWVGRRHAS